MGKDKQKKKELSGPWRNIHGAIWLIGLAYLFLTGNFWPGILFLVAASTLLEGILMLIVPSAFEAELPAPTADADSVAVPTDLPRQQLPPIPTYRTDLLPSNCPRCGAPTRGHEVRWSNPTSADCSFCGANLPMKR